MIAALRYSSLSAHHAGSIVTRILVDIGFSLSY